MSQNTIQRIKQYIDTKGIKVSVLEREVGMSNGSFASQLKNNKTIGVDKLENILNKYKDVNPEWLVTGKGNMFKLENLKEINLSPNQITEKESKDIPVYDIQSTAGIIDLFGDNINQKPVNYISIARVSDCDGALYVVGESMFPIFKSGDIVVFKKINNPANNIIWGEMYLVYVNNDGNEFFLTRFLNKSDKESYVQFVSQNPQHQTVEFPLSSIKALALVKASIRVNAQF